MQTPEIGTHLLVVVDPKTNNGEPLAAAVVTKIVSEGDDDNNPRLNLRVFLDTGSDTRLTNVLLLDERPDRLGAHSERNVAFASSRD